MKQVVRRALSLLQEQSKPCMKPAEAGGKLSTQLAACFYWFFCLAYSLTLKME
jgi:hypothetical protein